MKLLHRRPSVAVLGWVGATGTLVLVAASGIELAVVAAATPLFCFFVLAALFSSPTHRADMERRRATVQATRRLTAVLDECATLESFEAVTDRVAAGLVDLLDLHACWFEPGAGSDDLPELTADGDLTARVHHQARTGLLLPPLAALPVSVPSGPVGRFVLEADTTAGLSPERRLLAFAASRTAAVAAAGRDAGRRESTSANPTRPI